MMECDPHGDLVLTPVAADALRRVSELRMHLTSYEDDCDAADYKASSIVI